MDRAQDGIVSPRKTTPPRSRSTSCTTTSCTYNFARVHKTLRVAPTMEAGPADHVWSLEAIVALLDAAEKSRAGRIR